MEKSVPGNESGETRRDDNATGLPGSDDGGVAATHLMDPDAAQAWLAAIVESSEDAIISKTLDGVIMSWNGGAERLFGYSAQEAVGRPILLLIPPERYAEEDDILRRVRAGERIVGFETVRQTKQGASIPVSLTVSPVRDASGRIVGASKVVHDITLRKRTEQALQESDRRKDEFISVLSHELRNPLAPIVAAAEVLLRDPQAGETAQRVGTMIRRHATHMARLIDDLMDASRIRTGKVTLRKTWIELQELVASAVEMNRPLIDQRKQILAVDIPPGVHLLADRDRLVQVLSNLLNNASKYTEPGGCIFVVAERTDGSVVIRVRDSGTGIDQDALLSVFDLYMQADRNQGRTQSGLGIGLNVAQRLVQLHEGTLKAKSAGRGHGSEFIVELPLPPEVPKTAVTAPAVPRTGTVKQVLVVDDNRDAAETLSAILHMAGHEVKVAHDGVTGLEVALRDKPHAILLDLGLPQLTGEEVARRVREQLGEQVLLVAVTGWGTSADRSAARLAGFNHHLTKPVSVDEVLALLSD